MRASAKPWSTLLAFVLLQAQQTLQYISCSCLTTRHLCHSPFIPKKRHLAIAPSLSTTPIISHLVILSLVLNSLSHQCLLVPSVKQAYEDLVEGHCNSNDKHMCYSIIHLCKDQANFLIMGLTLKSNLWVVPNCHNVSTLLNCCCRFKLCECNLKKQNVVQYSTLVDETATTYISWHGWHVMLTKWHIKQANFMPTISLSPTQSPS